MKGMIDKYLKVKSEQKYIALGKVSGKAAKCSWQILQEVPEGMKLDCPRTIHGINSCCRGHLETPATAKSTRLKRRR